MGADDHLVIQPPPRPEETEAAPHPRRLRLEVVALAVAGLALATSGWQACEATRARIAAERSAEAAATSASEAKRMNELAEGGLEIARAAASAADRSAAAADKQAQAALAGNTLTAESLRARVTVRGVTLRQKPAQGQPLAADVSVENAGHSEAVNVRVRMTAFRGRDLPQGDMPSIPAPAGGSAGVLAPGGKMTSDLVIHATELTPQVVEALLSGSSHLFVFGVVTYETFGTGHQTDFCFIPSPTEIQNAQTCSRWNVAR